MSKEIDFEFMTWREKAKYLEQRVNRTGRGIVDEFFMLTRGWTNEGNEFQLDNIAVEVQKWRDANGQWSKPRYRTPKDEDRS